MSTDLSFAVLGPLAVTRGGSPLALQSARQRVLLARLLISANARVANDALVDALWGDEAPDRAEDALRVHVSQLRKRLGRELLGTLPGGYLLRVGPEQLDSHRFEAGVGAARRALEGADAAAAARTLERALALWRGEPYAEVGDRDAFGPEVQRLTELRLEARELAAEAALRLGRHAELVPRLAELVEAHPERERAWAQLMLALYRSGRQADALAAYRRAYRYLADELGVEPGPELRTLEGQILHQAPTLEPASRPIRLPHPLTSFVGRERELAAAHAALTAGRLVTFVGPGGSGKTRLAIETARRASALAPDGVWFVDLSQVGAGDPLPAIVLAELGRSRAGGADDLQTLLALLAARQALLILDNCEHLLDPVAELAATLLDGCVGLRILATSRERLRIPGEALFAVPPMALPPDEEAAAGRGGAVVTATAVAAPLGGPAERAPADAVALFTARAREVVPGFALDATTRPAVERIVRSLAGIPLAIELAAVRLAALSLEQLAAAIGVAMPALGAGSRVAVPRHATLRAAFAWSLDPLAPDQRSLFATLWVFAGGWTLEELAQVLRRPADQILESLTRLVEVSLVSVVRQGAQVRYRLLEPVRQYARSLVPGRGGVNRLRQAHAQVYLDIGRQGAERIRVRDADAMGPFGREEANLVAALEWFLERRAGAQASTLVVAMALYWDHVGQQQRAQHWVERVLPIAGQASPGARADLLVAGGRLATARGDLDSADRHFAAAETDAWASGDPRRQAHYLNELGTTRAIRGDMRSAIVAFERSLERARSAGLDDFMIAPMVNLGGVANWMGDTERGVRQASQVGALAEGRDSPMLRGLSLMMRGQAALFSGAAEEADRYLTAGVPLVGAHSIRALHELSILWHGMAALELGDNARAVTLAHQAQALAEQPPGWPVQLSAPELLGWAALARDDLAEAREQSVQAAHLSLETDNTGGLARALDLAAVLEADLGADDRATILLAAGSVARARLGLARVPYETRAVEQLERAVTRSLGRRRYGALRREGQALEPRAAIELALTGRR
jgi:predicted ATPase/DNA-binding SARP family transcriptional activator